MNPKFVSVLRCPEENCTGDLEIVERETEYNGQIMDGMLECQSCGERHRIRDGFPILLADTIDDESELSEV